MVSTMNDDAWKKLFPSVAAEELQTARDNLDAYLALAWEIFEQLQSATDEVDRDRAGL
jgi:hypothetical protein